MKVKLSQTYNFSGKEFNELDINVEESGLQYGMDKK